VRYRSDSGALWGLTTSSDRQRYDVLTRTQEGAGHIAIPVHPDERAWLCEKLAAADQGQPEPKRPETPTEGLARLMCDLLGVLADHPEGIMVDPDDPIVEEAHALIEEIGNRSSPGWNGGL
jgi:hypothetical protein